jgi:glycosyltransferase involved in cell wall biosynthesis
LQFLDNPAFTPTAGDAGSLTGFRMAVSKMTSIVAHILPFPAIGGTEIATMRLARAAQKQGFQSVMFCPTAVVRDFFAADGFRAFIYEQVQPSYRHPLDYWKNSLGLARRIREEGASLIHCADVAAAYFTSLAALLARRKLISHVRNRADVISTRDASFIRPVNRFIFVSKHTWQTFAVKVSPGRGTVLYDGVDPRAVIADDSRRQLAARVREEFGIPEGRKIIGMVARVAPQKDFATLARAAARVVPGHDVCFLIVGDYSSPPSSHGLRRDTASPHFAGNRGQIRLYRLPARCAGSDFRRGPVRVEHAP